MITDDTGFSDPYCDLFVLCPNRKECKHMWRSATKMQTLDPNWNESQRVPMLNTEALLHLVCFDWDKVGTDDFLGECLVDLSQYSDGETHQLTLMLDQYSSDSTSEEVKGYIVVEVRLVGQGPERSS